MANVSRPWGFRPVRDIDSNPYNGQSALYAHSASDANNLFVGDLVKIDTSNRSTALTDVLAPLIPFVTPTGSTITTTVYRGAIVGIVPEPEYSMSATASLGLMYIKTSTARYCHVASDPYVLFEVEESGTNSYTSASNNGINKLIDVTATAGSTTTGISGYTVNGASVATTNKPIRIYRATQRIDNFQSTAADTSPYWHWDVLFANSDLETLLVGA